MTHNDLRDYLKAIGGPTITRVALATGYSYSMTARILSGHVPVTDRFEIALKAALPIVEVPKIELRFCPCCGCHLEGFLKAQIKMPVLSCT